MGKTWNRNAKNPKWRRAKLDREKQKNGSKPGRMFEFDKSERQDDITERVPDYDRIDFVQ
jgi:hypothetical protein